MKIGIITLHWPHNYGAMLQAYALREVVQGLGYDVSVLDYMTPYQEKATRLYPFRSVGRLKRWMKYALILTQYPTHYRRWKGFENFKREVIGITKKRYYCLEDMKETLGEYDIYICGSDQIWRYSPSSQTGDNPVFFLQFIPNGVYKKVSYAPSFGGDGILEDKKSKYIEGINSIDCLSVRERDGQKIIQELTGRQAELVLDPTLLLSQNQWLDIATPARLKEPYVLVYYVGGDVAEINEMIAQARAKLGNVKIVLLASGVSVVDELAGIDITIKDASPQEFIGLFSQAKFVCTSSFHGCVFSYIFRKPFCAVMPGQISSRLINLSETFGLQSRMMIDGVKLPDNPLDIDYSIAEENHKKEKKKSLGFLRKALEVKMSN